MDRLHVMEVFAAVADAGSFAGAARRLRLSPAAVTRAVAALEDRLGVRLVNRTTRSLSLTEPGLGYLAAVRRTLADLEEAERLAAGTSGVPQGHLRLTAPVTFGRMHLMPVLAEFLQGQQQLTASLTVLDRVANLIEEGFDVAVRIARLPDSTMVARRIGEVRRLLVAAPAYLAERGTPRTAEDLSGHAVVAFEGMFPGGVWRFERDGRSETVELAPRLAVNDAAAAVASAERGQGITGVLSYMVAPQLAAGTLVPVLADLAPPPLPVQIVYPQSRLVAPKVRAFVDFAAPRLARAIASAAGWRAVRPRACG
jgi:DNA-binding transcriptional LysR family regulator